MHNRVQVALVALLSALVFGCTPALGDLSLGGRCHETTTGEVLADVLDANGAQWEVQKFELIRGLPFCGVPVRAVLGAEPVGIGVRTVDALYRLDGTPIRVYGPSRGLYWLDDYEWY